jgi:branched-chain amino acid transport system substrate-binding protein
LYEEKQITRRHFLGAFAAVAAGAALAACAQQPTAPAATQAPAAAKPVIKIGHLTPRTGFLAPAGFYSAVGVGVGFDMVNNAGGVLGGRKFDVIAEDSVDAGTAVQKTIKLFEKDKVDFIMGEISSASALAEAENAAKYKKIFINTGANSDQLRQDKCSHYSFHVESSNTQSVKACMYWLSKNKADLKNYYFPYSDYAFGQNLYQVAKAEAAKYGFKEIGNDPIPTGTTEFSSYIQKIKSAKPDIIFNCLAGTDWQIFVKQYADAGAPFYHAAAQFETNNVWGVARDTMAAIGGIGAAVWYFKVDDPGSIKFVEEATKKLGKPPDDQCYKDAIGATLLAQAVEKTGGTDSEAIIKYWETGAEFDLWKGRKGKWNPWDHQLLQTMYTLALKPKDKLTDQWDWLDVAAVNPGASDTLESIHIAKADSVCKF